MKVFPRVCDNSCGWSGSFDKMLLIEVMPHQHRASHRKAGTWGQYPLNGAKRIRVCMECAANLTESDDYNHVIIERESK